MTNERVDGDGNKESANRAKKVQRKLEREAKRVLKAEFQRCIASGGAAKEHVRGVAQQYDIVIVPIFWKKQVEMTKDIIAAAAKVEAQFALALPGVRVHIDAGEDFSPGQKYAHWESKGVKLRVEIGPKNIKKGDCVLAHFATPGALAKRVDGLSMADDMVPLIGAIYRLETHVVVQGIARSEGSKLYTAIAALTASSSKAAAW
jgi:DNA-binding protein YbaB